MRHNPTGKPVNPRRFLRRAGTAGAVFGAAAFTPWPAYGEESGAAALAVGSSLQGADPDELFRKGQFAKAASGYAQRLEENPNDAHAIAQLGYIALLSNRFEDAEQFLSKAVELAPDDTAPKSRLADCFVRQDDFARAVPLLRAAGNEPEAAQYESLTGTPYELHGPEVTRLPMLHVDPLPVVQVSVNGLPPEPVFFDTGASSLGVWPELAEEAGLREVATREGGIGGAPVTLHLGVLDSLRVGDIEVRNLPVVWTDGHRELAPTLWDGSKPRGTIGTVLFYHFLTTLDYANRSLILRRKTDEQLKAFQAEAHDAGADSMPFWLAPTHFLFARGTLNGHGPKMCLVDTGGSGIGVSASEEMAQEVGFEIDYDNPWSFNEAFQVFPLMAEEVALGSTVRRKLPGVARAAQDSEGSGRGSGLESRHGFESAATISHEFFRPLAATFDFANMTMYLAHKP
jgi:tetratricopeptide (TPR) repeat protein